MKKLFWILTGAVVVAFFFASDGFTENTCVVTEKSIISSLSSSNNELQKVNNLMGILGLGFASAFMGGKLGDGKMLAFAAKEEYPHLPAQVGCIIIFWDNWLRKL